VPTTPSPAAGARGRRPGMPRAARSALRRGAREGPPSPPPPPACGVLHPMLLTGSALHALRDRPIYLIHGTLDWMFPVGTTRVAREVLTAAGARLVYREIEDLSHTYPRDENPKILDWLTSGPAL